MAEFMYADRIPAEILAWGNELAQIRRDIHQHPELGFDTSRTCGVIATKLSEWGVEFDDKLRRRRCNRRRERECTRPDGGASRRYGCACHARRI